ncbi:GSCOCG00009113001-RA-CDS [Cotesia congregata]|nr:GSCOCG00009113001-RA-CDS [Cotesia congregata]
MVQQRIPGLNGHCGGRRFVLTLATGMIFGFFSACLLITATKDVPHILNWMPGRSSLRDPHHYSELDNEVIYL